MKPIIFNIVIGLLIIFAGLFLKKIFYFFLKGNYSIDFSKAMHYTQIIFIIVGLCCVLLSIWEFLSPANISIISIIKTLILLIGALIIIGLWIYKIKLSNINPFFLVFCGIFLALAGYSFVKTVSFNNADNVSLNNNTIDIKGDYSLTIPMNSIVDISINQEVPKLKERTNGIAFMDTRKGFFNLENGDSCYVSIGNMNNDSFIHINRKNNIPVILNCKDENETLSLYQELVK